jgi:hypothetical protein
MKTFNLRRNLAPCLLALTAISLFASTAAAQIAAMGKFTIPFEAQWGVWTIPAGEYTFTLDRPTAQGIMTIRSKDGTATFMLFHKAVLGHELFGDSELHLIRDNGKWRIAEMHLAPTGVALCYCHPPAKSNGRQTARNRNVHVIPVTVFGK